jgi:hypothetical protein
MRANKVNREHFLRRSRKIQDLNRIKRFLKEEEHAADSALMKKLIKIAEEGRHVRRFIVSKLSKSKDGNP